MRNGVEMSLIQSDMPDIAIRLKIKLQNIDYVILVLGNIIFQKVSL
jgi:hypothetical protein